MVSAALGLREDITSRIPFALDGAHGLTRAMVLPVRDVELEQWFRADHAWSSRKCGGQVALLALITMDI
jgi:hypothetical protein